MRLMGCEARQSHVLLSGLFLCLVCLYSVRYELKNNKIAT